MHTLLLCFRLLLFLAVLLTESCLDTARSSLPVIRQEEEEEIQRDEEAFQVNGIDYHREVARVIVCCNIFVRTFEDI